MGDNGERDDEAWDEAAWAEYLRTSPIMSNVPLTSHPSERVSRGLPQHLSVWNSSLRLLVATPALWAGFNTVVALLIGLWWWVLIVTLLVAFVASVALVVSDERMLRAEGLDDTVSPFLAVVPLVYLWRRGNLLFESRPNAFRPFWAHVAVIVAVVVFVVVAPVLSGIVGLLDDAKQLLGS